MTLLTVLAFLLLVAGVIGSAVPKAPGVSLSLAGVYLYWWASGFTEPTALLLGVITVVGLLAVVGGWFEDVIAARIGGASTKTAMIAGAVGFALFFIGPIAMLVGTVLTVFLLEYRRQRDVKAGLVAAFSVVVATIGSRIISVLLSTLILVSMLAVWLL